MREGGDPQPREVVIHRGDDRRPLVVFVHGMGMNVKAWSRPSEARILGGKYPLRILAKDPDDEILTSFEDFRRRGYSLLSWTQSRPAGPIMIAVRELRGLIHRYMGLAAGGIVFICHSRGGLIARKCLEDGGVPLRGMITLATPHKGTSMAKWAVYISPLASVLEQLLKLRKADVDSGLQRILGFLGGRGLREMLPGSEFFRGLRDGRLENARYLSIGGTNPDLLRALSVSLPELVSKAIPEILIPEEMREGRGDGLVSAASSVLPYADEHVNFPVNHGSILFDREVRGCIIRAMESWES